MNLHVIKLPKNTGTPGLPRNVGIQFARGKYIAFLDSDDLFTKTALEELTTLAEDYQADAVNMNEFFAFNDRPATTEELSDVKNHHIVNCHNVSDQNAGVPRLQEAVIVADSLAERINHWINFDFHWATWATFCRRDFVIINQINFPKMLSSEDQIFNFNCICSAKKLLRVPNITYIYRIRHDSLSHETANSEKYFHKWLRVLNKGCNEFDNVMKRFSLFAEHPDYRYAVLDWHVRNKLKQLQNFYAQIHPAALYPLVEKEFHGDDAAVAAYLFNTVNIQRLQIMRLQHELAKFHQQ